MRPLLLSLLLSFHLRQPYTAASTLKPRDVIPAPIVFPSSGTWNGYDGPWSTFNIRVGTPGQLVRVLISTANQETLVVLPEGCPNGGLQSCSNDRGGIFTISGSSTWKNNAFFNLALDSELVNVTANGRYGFDTVALGSSGQQGPSLDGQVVAGVGSNAFYVGLFGMTPRAVNFTGDSTAHPSYLGSLKAKNLIPSESYGFTAGAAYRQRRVPGSLIFGGYDASRFTPNSLSITFADNDAKDLTIALRGIKASAGGSDSQLLPRPSLTYIDSAASHIWLPVEACLKFEQYFGLIYDQTTNLYLVNETLHSTLVSQNASVTFTISSGLTMGATVDIVLPYASFDLRIVPPAVKNESYYFPLRRAVNESQYRLGRTFLQEAYLIVDYEHRNFSLSQALFPESSASRIVPILNSTTTSANRPSPTSTSKKGGISGGAIAGIVIGVLVIAALIAAFFLLRRRRARRARASDSDREGEKSPSPSVDGESTAVGTVRDPHSPQITGAGAGTAYHDNAAAHMAGAASSKQELDGSSKQRHEIAANEPVQRPGSLPGGLPSPARPNAIHELVGDSPRLSELPSPESEGGGTWLERPLSPMSPLTTGDEAGGGRATPPPQQQMSLSGGVMHRPGEEAEGSGTSAANPTPKFR